MLLPEGQTWRGEEGKEPLPGLLKKSGMEWDDRRSSQVAHTDKWKDMLEEDPWGGGASNHDRSLRLNSYHYVGRTIKKYLRNPLFDLLIQGQC